jgi:hypothetical protein
MSTLEYNIITEENRYEFAAWCSVLQPGSICKSNFNLILQINMETWIYENNITWQYAYGNIVDTLKAQTTMQAQDTQTATQDTREDTQDTREDTQDTQDQKDKAKKPLDKIKRRELFAKMAEQRQNKSK